jgi:hypothetical protein
VFPEVREIYLEADRIPLPQLSLILERSTGLADMKGVTIIGGVSERELFLRMYQGRDALDADSELPEALKDCEDELHRIRATFPNCDIVVNYRRLDL